MQPHLHDIFLQDFHNRSKLLVRPCLEEWGPDSPKKVLGLQYISLIMIICKWKKSAPNLGSKKCRVGHPCAVWLLAPYPLQQASPLHPDGSHRTLRNHNLKLKVYGCTLVLWWKHLLGGNVLGGPVGPALVLPTLPHKCWNCFTNQKGLNPDCSLYSKTMKTFMLQDFENRSELLVRPRVRSGGLTAQKKVLDLITYPCRRQGKKRLPAIKVLEISALKAGSLLQASSLQQAHRA